jgi:predicted Zn-dependent protease with MMP-like domain
VAATVMALTAPAGAAEWRVRMGGSAHAQAVHRGLAGAQERLGRVECRKLFTDFQDLAGRPLQDKLDGLKLTGPEFLRYVGFYEGYGLKRCGQDRVMAFTQPGSLAVRVCPQIARRDQETVELILIHEMLHALGLGENPPTTSQITDQVTRRCGGRDDDLKVQSATR